MESAAITAATQISIFMFIVSIGDYVRECSPFTILMLRVYLLLYHIFLSRDVHNPREVFTANMRDSFGSLLVSSFRLQFGYKIKTPSLVISRQEGVCFCIFLSHYVWAWSPPSPVFFVIESFISPQARQHFLCEASS